MPMPIYPSAVEGSDSLSLAYTLIPLIPITLTPDPNSNPYAYPTPPFLTLFFSFPFASYPISPPTLSLSPPPPSVSQAWIRQLPQRGEPRHWGGYYWWGRT